MSNDYLALYKVAILFYTRHKSPLQRLVFSLIFVLFLKASEACLVFLKSTVWLLLSLNYKLERGFQFNRLKT